MNLYGFFGVRRTRPTPVRSVRFRRRAVRLGLEQLEDRSVPANFSAANISDLVNDINLANQNAEADTITLAPGATFTLTTWDNWTDNTNGLPQITAGDNLTIVGNGDIIERSTASPATFRLLDVASGASLTLEDLTLQGGYLWPSGANQAAQGGAISNHGSLTLQNVIVQDNTVHGIASDGTSPFLAEGGGIFSNGSLTMEGCRVQNNLAAGGAGHDTFIFWGSAVPPADGGDGLGGGLYVAGGRVTMTDSTITRNTACGGDGGDGTINRVGYFAGGDGGSGFGGGLYLAGGTVTLRQLTVDANDALSGNGGQGRKRGTRGLGVGGGLYIDAAAFVEIDAFSLGHAKHNHASTDDSDIHGSFSLIP